MCRLPDYQALGHSRRVRRLHLPDCNLAGSLRSPRLPPRPVGHGPNVQPYEDTITAGRSTLLFVLGVGKEAAALWINWIDEGRIQKNGGDDGI